MENVAEMKLLVCRNFAITAKAIINLYWSFAVLGLYNNNT